MNSPANTVLERLEANGSRVKKQGAGYMACCPAHADHNPSLSISEEDDVKALLHCHAGCKTENVCDALGIKMKDLFPQKSSNGTRSPSEIHKYGYCNENGEEVYRIVKLLDSDGKKTFRAEHLTPSGWKSGMGEIRPFLYNLPQVGAAMLGCDPVWIVEGEKDADTLTGLGYAATTNPFGAGKFTDAMISSLDNATQIKIIIDNDLPGISHGKDIYRRLRVRQPDRQIEIYRSTIGKDITEHLASGGTF